MPKCGMGTPPARSLPRPRSTALISLSSAPADAADSPAFSLGASPATSCQVAPLPYSLSEPALNPSWRGGPRDQDGSRRALDSEEIYCHLLGRGSEGRPMSPGLRAVEHSTEFRSSSRSVLP